MPACTPTRIECLVIGEPNQSIIHGPRVPAGQVWLIKSAGIGTSSNIGARVDYSLCIDHWVFGQGPIGSVGSWFVPLELSDGNTYNGTPMLGLKRPIVLEEGECLMARANGLPSATKMDLFYVGWSFSAECLTRLILQPEPQAITVNVPPPPDFSALLQAAQDAADKLSALSQVPVP